MNQLIPSTVNENGVITGTDSFGFTHCFHTNSDEAQAFFRSVQCLAAGCEELGLLISYAGDPTLKMRRQRDGRTDQELKDDWLSKVTDAGMSEDAALQFLNARLACLAS